MPTHTEPPATMPFGRYKDWALPFVPDDYLHWLMRRGDLERRWPVFERQLRAECERRWTTRAAAQQERGR